MSQNTRQAGQTWARSSAHLDGRVGWAEQLNPARGAKLRAMFEAIAWGG